MTVRALTRDELLEIAKTDDVNAMTHSQYMRWRYARNMLGMPTSKFDFRTDKKRAEEKILLRDIAGRLRLTYRRWRRAHQNLEFADLESVIAQFIKDTAKELSLQMENHNR